MPAKIAVPGLRRVAVADEEERGVGDLLQAGIGHLEDADLGGRPEAVLHRAQQAEMLAGVAFEIEHRVDHVLDHARAGDLAVLGDVADQHDRGAARLGVADQRLRRGAHLRDRAGRALGEVGPQRLDGIDDDEVDRRAGLQRREDVLDMRLGGERDRRVARGRGARRGAGSARSPPRRKRRRRGARRGRARRRPGSGWWTCRCRDRRRPGAPSPARSRRRRRGRTRRCRRACAAARRSRRRAATSSTGVPRPVRSATGAAAGASSASVFHSPQDSQRPCQLGGDGAAIGADILGARGARHQAALRRVDVDALRRGG